MATVTATTTAHARHSLASSSSSSNANNTSTSGDAYDLQACLEILKRLAPKVSPDLPQLHVVPQNHSGGSSSSSSGQSSTKRKATETSSSSSKQAKRPRRSLSAEPSATESSSDKPAAKADKHTDKRKSSSSSKSPRVTDDVEKDDSDAYSSSAGAKQRTASEREREREHRRSSNGTSLRDATTTSATATVRTREQSNDESVIAKSGRKPSSSGLAGKKSPRLEASRGEDASSNRTRTVSAPSATASRSAPAPLPLIAAASGSTASPAASTLSPALPSPAFTSASSSHLAIASTSADTAHVNNSNDRWTRDRFKRVAAVCREKGRALKHSGDKRMRELSAPSSSGATASASLDPKSRHVTPVLALLEQIDAVVLYAYAFWCEDQAVGCVRNRQVSSSSSASASSGSGSANGLAASTSSSVSLGSSTTSKDGGAIAQTTATSNTTTVELGQSQSQSQSEPAVLSPTAWKPGCIAENWKSIFGLVVFVRGRAEKLAQHPPNPVKMGARLAEGVPRAMEIVIAWLNMLEALILQHLTTNSSRNLNSQASRLLSSLGSSSAASSAASPANGPSPPGGDNESTTSSTPSLSATSQLGTSPPETSNFLQGFLKLQADLERIHALWPISQNVLLNPHVSSALPGAPSMATDSSDILTQALRKGRMAYDLEPTKLDDIVIPNLPRDEQDDSAAAAGDEDGTSLNAGSAGSKGPKSPEDLFKDEENYFSFAWPVVIHHQNSIAHTASFGRALVSEMADRLGIEYTPPNIEPPAPKRQ